MASKQRRYHPVNEFSKIASRLYIGLLNQGLKSNSTLNCQHGCGKIRLAFKGAATGVALESDVAMVTAMAHLWKTMAHLWKSEVLH